LKSIYDNK